LGGNRSGRADDEPGSPGEILDRTGRFLPLKPRNLGLEQLIKAEIRDPTLTEKEHERVSRELKMPLETS
jgi:hypothetical protein